MGCGASGSEQNVEAFGIVRVLGISGWATVPEKCASSMLPYALLNFKALGFRVL